MTVTDAARGGFPGWAGLARVRATLLGAGPSALLVFAAALFGAGYFQGIDPPPFPVSYDDWSFLLAADTFRSGRLANPTPDAWVHFESPEILLEPRYVSAKAPFQGFLLAAGMLLGDPLRGAALGFALACVAVAWMLRGWTSPGWALVGALTLALHSQLLESWASGFSGGASGLLGGALLYGALPRVLRGERAAGAALGAGLAILALAQPYAGLVACVPAAAYVAAGLRRRDAARRPALAPALALAALVATAGLSFKAYYHWRTTGDPLQSPEALYQETYAAVPPLLVLPRGPTVEYRHESMSAYFGDRSPGARPFLKRRDLAGFWKGMQKKFGSYWRFYLLYAFSAALLALPFARREPGVPFAAAALALFAVALALQTFDDPVHVAPFLPVALLLFTGSLRALARLAIRGVPLGALLGIYAVGIGLAEHHDALLDELTLREFEDLSARPGIEARVRRSAEETLLFVAYRHGHDVLKEWVYNAADLAAAPVIWARSLSPEENAALAARYPEREPWVLGSSGGGVSLRPHPNARRWRFERRLASAPRIQALPEEEQKEVMRWLQNRARAQPAVEPELKRWRSRIRSRLRREREERPKLGALADAELRPVLDWAARRARATAERRERIERVEKRLLADEASRQRLERLSPRRRDEVLDWLGRRGEAKRRAEAARRRRERARRSGDVPPDSRFSGTSDASNGPPTSGNREERPR